MVWEPILALPKTASWQPITSLKDTLSPIQTPDLAVRTSTPAVVPQAPTQPFANTGFGIALNTILGLVTPTPYLQVAKTIAQGAASAAASVGLGVINNALKGNPNGNKIAGTLSGQGLNPDAVRPTVDIPTYLQPLFGTNTISDVQTVVSQLAPKFATNPIVKKLGLTSLSVPLAIGTVVGGDALNLSGFGGSEENAVSALVKETDTARVSNILQKMGITPEVAAKFAPDIAAAKTTADVQNVLAVAKATHGIALITDAEKGASTPSDTGTASDLNPVAAEPSTSPPIGESQPPVPGISAREPDVSPNPDQPATSPAPRPESLSSPEGSTEAPNAQPKINSSVNPDNLVLSPEARALFPKIQEALSPKVADAVGSSMTNKEITDFAKANPNLNLNSVGREASLKFNAAVFNTRQQVVEDMEKLARGELSPDMQENLVKSYMAVDTNATDVGRSLNAFKLAATAEEKDGVNLILSKLNKAGADADAVAKAARDVDFNDYKQVVTFYRKFVSPTIGDWTDLIRYNSMLSSPLTLANIISGNLFNLATQPFVKTTAGAIDWLKTGILGGKQTHFIGEGPMYVKGAAKNIGNAFNNMMDILKGIRDPKMLDFNIPIASEGAKGKFVSMMNIASTLHNAEYQFFNTLAKGGSASSIDYKDRQGVETAFADVAAQAEADKTTYRDSTLPEGQGDVLDGIDVVANLAKQLATQDTSKVFKWLAKFTLPFIKISTNMAKQMVEFSPAGFSTMYGAEDQITQFAKASLGTAAFTAVGMMAATGNITGAAPTNPTDKNAFEASGRQPYSFKVGNTWFSYNKLSPSMSIPMLLAASYVQSQATGVGKDKMQSVLEAFGAFGKYIADQSYVKNIGDLVSAIQGDTTKGNPVDTLITNDAEQLIPFRAFSGWLAKLLDPDQRQIDSSQGEIHTQLQLLMEQIPGLRNQVAAKVDAAGNAIPNQDRFLNAVSPLQTSQSTLAKDQTYQDFLTIKGLNSAATANSKDLTTQAQQVWSQLQTLPKDQAKAQLQALAKSNPTLAAKIITVAKAGAVKLTPTEQSLLSASTEARAQFIAQQKSNYTSAADYKAYLKDLAAKKILTSTVLTRLTQLLKP